LLDLLSHADPPIPKAVVLRREVHREFLKRSGLLEDSQSHLGGGEDSGVRALRVRLSRCSSTTEAHVVPANERVTDEPREPVTSTPEPQSEGTRYSVSSCVQTFHLLRAFSAILKNALLRCVPAPLQYSSSKQHPGWVPRSPMRRRLPDMSRCPRTSHPTYTSNLPRKSSRS
jgi:hypothetical protein